MKNLLLKLMLITGLVLGGATGCSNRQVDTAKLHSAFQSAPPDIQTTLEQGITAINAGKFSEALPALQRVAFAAKMNQEQRLILEDAIKKVKAKAK